MLERLEKKARPSSRCVSTFRGLNLLLRTYYCSAYLTRRDFKCEICFQLGYSRDSFIILIYFFFFHKETTYWKLKAHDFMETPERMMFMYSKGRTQKKGFLLNNRDRCILH